MNTKNYLTMLALAAGLALAGTGLTSCSGDDDNPVDNPEPPSVGQATVKELLNLTKEDIGWVIGTDGKAYMNVAAATSAGTEPLAMVAYIDNYQALAIQITESPQEVSWEDANAYINSLPKFKHTVWELPSKWSWLYMLEGCAIEGDMTTVTAQKLQPIEGFQAKIAATGMGWQTNWYWTSTEVGKSATIMAIDILQGGEAPPYALINTAPKSYPYGVRGCLVIKFVP